MEQPQRCYRQPYRPRQRVDADSANVPCEWNGSAYTASADLNAADGYCYYVLLTAADGTQTEVAINTPTAPTDDALINLESALNSYCNMTVASATQDGSTLTITGGSVEVQAPRITNEGETITCSKAELVLTFDEEIVGTAALTMEALSIQIWKNYWDDIRFQLTPPGLGTSFKIPNQPGSWRFSFGTTQILVYYGLPSPYSLYQEIAIDLLPRRDYISGGVWFFTAEARSVIEGIIDLWMPAAAIRGTATQFLTPTTETTLTIPSTAGNVITVGAYNSFTNTLAPFSGRGYTWNTGQVKPDLVAPGVDITSCAVGGGYESRSGTSMAAPFVSGSCALLMQWGILQNNDPFLYGEKMKAYLIRGERE